MEVTGWSLSEITIQESAFIRSWIALNRKGFRLSTSYWVALSYECSTRPSTSLVCQPCFSEDCSFLIEMEPLNTFCILSRQWSATMVWTAGMYVLGPFMANAIVAWPWMHCQGHLAHGISRLHVYCSVWSLHVLHSLGPSVCTCKLQRDLHLLLNVYWCMIKNATTKYSHSSSVLAWLYVRLG